MQKKYEAPELEVLKPFIDESICNMPGSGDDNGDSAGADQIL